MKGPVHRQIRVRPASTDPCETPKLLAIDLPPYLAERAVDGLSWLSLISSVTSVALMAINGGLQPEVAIGWAHPVLRAVMLGMVGTSVGFALLLRSGWLAKGRLLDLGMFYQMAIAFAVSLLESSAHRDPDAPILGNSGVAVWMMLCGRLMPMAPVKSAITGILCAASWPFAYWLNLQLLGFEAMPVRRLLVRVLPLLIVAVWVFVLNRRILKLYAIQHRAEEVGSYVLTCPLGSGGMGEVWRARHRTLARDAAVKLIRPELLTSVSGKREQMLKRRFEREAQVTASLRSPHTVALYDYGQTKEGAFYYVMELLEGIDLQAMVERFGPLAPGRVARVLLQVAQSLEEAHQARLVHRDIKPRNIMINKLGVNFDVVKVLDFGLVKNRDHQTATSEGVAAGTPGYLSPESVTGDRPVDARSDIYSLGCTAYFLLTGYKVFEAPTPTASALAHIQQTPVPVGRRSEMPVPADLEAIVMQMLEKDPDRRIPSARELTRRLLALPCLSEWPDEHAERWWNTHMTDAGRYGDNSGDWEPTATAGWLNSGHTV